MYVLLYYQKKIFPRRVIYEQNKFFVTLYINSTVRVRDNDFMRKVYNSQWFIEIWKYIIFFKFYIFVRNNFPLLYLYSHTYSDISFQSYFATSRKLYFCYTGERHFLYINFFRLMYTFISKSVEHLLLFVIHGATFSYILVVNLSLQVKSNGGCVATKP